MLRRCFPGRLLCISWQAIDPDIVGSRLPPGCAGAGYNWMADFSEPIGARKDYSGLDVGVAIGWMWGRGDVR